MRIQLQGPGHAASLLAQLNSCRQSRQYCDVLLQVGNRSFAAHRAVLACAGTYFRNLFARAAPSPTAAFSLEFISPANFEKLLTFVYTGEILTDLIDVGVLYELAERLGVVELVRACHATFPDLQASVSANCIPGSPGDLPPNSSVVAAAAVVGAASASSACSSVASCSSMSSPAAPTPAGAPSPLFQTRAAGAGHDALPGALPLDLKEEDVQSHVGYGQVAAGRRTPGRRSLPTAGLSGRCDGALPAGPVLQLKVEPGLGVDQGGCDVRDMGGQKVSCFTGGTPPRSCAEAPSDSCSFPVSSAQLGAEACGATPSSGEPLGGLRVVSVEGGMVEVQRDGRQVFEKVEEGGEVEEEKEEEDEGEDEGEGEKEREPLKGNRAMEGTDEDQWRQLAGEIIELSDDEDFMEEGDEEDDDEDGLVYVENGGGGGGSSSQATGNVLPCKACEALLPANPDAIRRHAETHLTELGLCRVCGASLPDRDAGVAHSLSHVGVQLFTCDMCHSQFCSQNKLLRHHRQAATGYAIPQVALTSSSSSQSLGPELQCAVCSKTLSKDFQTVKDHLLSHVCPQSLSCGVCHLPQLSLCSLLWHALAHLSLPVFTCPHCARCFVERSMLDRHMAAHAEEAAAKEREQLALRAYRVGAGGTTGEELHCFLCPQAFRSASAFQYHLGLHTTESPGSAGGGRAHGWLGRRKADPTPEGLPSSTSSLREAGSLVKMSNMGLGMSFGVPDTFFQGALQGPPPGVLTNGNSGQDGGAAAAGVRGKWYRCRYCGKCFAHSGEFTYHLRIHTGEKPYQCKVCLRFFRGRSTMICHLKTHAGALMYRCTVCGLFFSTLKMVSSHMELHTDRLPPDFNIEQTFMYNDHSKEPLPNADG